MKSFHLSIPLYPGSGEYGVPVVRLARGMRACVKIADKNTDDLFIDGGLLTPEAASALLTECLARHGTLPRVRTTGTSSTGGEQAELRRKLQLYQAEFSSRQPELVAVR